MKKTRINWITVLGIVSVVLLVVAAIMFGRVIGEREWKKVSGVKQEHKCWHATGVHSQELQKWMEQNRVCPEWMWSEWVKNSKNSK
mgnify:CR=1 FL=1